MDLRGWSYYLFCAGLLFAVRRFCPDEACIAWAMSGPMACMIINAQQQQRHQLPCFYILLLVEESASVKTKEQDDHALLSSSRTEQLLTHIYASFVLYFARSVHDLTGRWKIGHRTTRNCVKSVRNQANFTPKMGALVGTI
jgi:hypothetical protein